MNSLGEVQKLLSTKKYCNVDYDFLPTAFWYRVCHTIQIWEEVIRAETGIMRNVLSSSSSFSSSMRWFYCFGIAEYHHQNVGADDLVLTTEKPLFIVMELGLPNGTNIIEEAFASIVPNDNATTCATF